jgi:hypothetical protein
MWRELAREERGEEEDRLYLQDRSSFALKK